MPSGREQSQADCGGEAATQGQSNLGRERHTRGHPVHTGVQMSSVPTGQGARLLCL